jgi:endogenous inhibitor of DNA gyrase (YacG/DUF329 family)
MAKCPICNKDARPRSDNRAFPFCTPRCKSIDLGKWLAEEYRVPVEDSSDEVPERPSPRSDPDMRN